MESKYSFKDFLTKETYIGIDPETEEDIFGVITKIEIPMIQRDYAQGRIKEFKEKHSVINDTGSRFLKSIFNSIKNNTEIELDFIYGSIEERPIPKSHDKEYVYTPLDGQQRLTTLFLLHWYFGMRELSDDNDALEAHLSLLGKFTYLTRSSSRTFCECICNWGKMEHLNLGDEKPSLLIENCPWYFKESSKDPTVKAMLAMLDHIDMLYQTENNDGVQFLPRLENLKFYAFPLNKYKLTEDLYIKMNARGKQLSGYENFKADLINWMKNKNNPESSKFAQDITYRGRKMKYYMAFAQKMDNEWTDIFWNAIKANHMTESDISMDGKTVDGMFMRFFIRFFFNNRILTLQKTTGLADEAIANDEIVKYFYGENGVDTSVTYNNNDFENIYQQCLSYDTVVKIDTFLDRITDKLAIINREFVPSWFRDSSTRTDSFYSSKISWQARIVFHATFMYFIKNEDFDEINFCDWIKMVWNFVVDPSIRNIKDNIGTLKFIDELSDHSNNIVSWISSDTAEGSRLKTQFAEEHIKAQLISSNSEWRRLLTEGEKHPLLKGRILFLLPDDENTDTETYKKHLKITRKIIPSDKNDFLWIRAILSQIDDYDIQTSSLTLSDIRENWKTSISDNLRKPMQALLRNLSTFAGEDENKLSQISLRQHMQSLCDNYQQKEGIEWIYPLVSWNHNEQTLLSDYSDSRKVEEKSGDVYLCYKTTLQSESCILLTSPRDKIISKVLPYTNRKFEWIYTSYHCNIHDSFFRGMKVTLFRGVELGAIGPIKCAYVFDAKQIIVGIRYIDNPVIATENNQNTWACSKIYNITNICDEDDISTLVELIEEEVFNLENFDSLLFKALNSEWHNEVSEEPGEQQSSTPKGLRVTFSDGYVVSNRWAIEAFIDTLKRIGLEKIPQVGILHSGYNLVSKDKRPNGNWQREVSSWYVYSNISNDVKCDDLRKISTALNLDLIVEDGIE